jgi:hypothetical protein
MFMAALILALGIWPASAQDAVRLKSMTVSLWPEYDDAGVLVIYRGAIADDVALPVTLRFLIPKAAGQPSSTAGVDATGQYRYRSYQVVDAGEYLEVSYTNPYREFQMEYYYNPLTSNDTLRAFEYRFRADYPVDELVVEVKEPAGAQNLTLTPVATGTGTDFDDLPLQKYAVGPFALGQVFQFSATYEKTDPRLTAEILGFDMPGTAEFEDVAKPAGSQNVVAYILIGAAATLLIGAAVYAYVQTRKKPKRKAPAPARPTKKTKSRKTMQPKTGPSAGGFCHQCGARLRPDAQFCPKCGAKVKR